MRVGNRQTFHAGAAGAADAFLRVFDHHTVGGGEFRTCVSIPFFLKTPASFAIQTDAYCGEMEAWAIVMLLELDELRSSAR